MVKYISKIVLSIIIFLLHIKASAQFVDVNDIALKDILRVKSLMDTIKNENSFIIRNSSISQDFTKPSWRKIKFTKFSFEYQHQDNSNLPLGYNNGIISSSVGAQHFYATNINLQWGRLVFQIAPEKIISDNKFYERLPFNFDGSQNGDDYWRRYYVVSENVIEKEIIANNNLTDQNFLGQSSIKFNSKNFSYGISNENLWWGPGLYNSLILTNNAPGFLHFTINTNKPIKTKFGNFETQIIGGNLINSNSQPINNDNSFAKNYYTPKPELDRYITGMILTYQPQIISNLHIGFANMAYMYKKNMNGLEDLTPFTNFTKFSDLKKRPALGSVFIKYALPKDHAEFYIEYGRKDIAATPLNIFYDSIPTGYVGGIRKIFPIKSKSNLSAIVLNIEVCRLQLMNPNQIWDSNLLPKVSSWYTSKIVPHGYTNRGQLIGSNIGPGGNSQIIQLSWIKGIKKLGFGVERVANNQDFYYYNYFNGLKYPGPNFKYWADMIYNISFRWDIGNIIVFADFKKSNSFNYMWTKIGDGGLYGPSSSDKENVQINFAIKYLISRKF